MGFTREEVVRELRAMAVRSREAAKDLEREVRRRYAQEAPRTMMGVAIDEENIEWAIKRSAYLEWAANELAKKEGESQ